MRTAAARVAGGSALAENVGVFALDESEVVLRVWLVARTPKSSCRSSCCMVPLMDAFRVPLFFGRLDVDGSGMVCKCGFE